MICLCVRSTCTSKLRNNNKQRKNSTNCCKHGDAVTWLARQRRNCASLIQILHSYSIGAKKKNWFIISTEQRKYRARAMQWTCWAYQSSDNMELCLFKGGKWRADGRKPKPKNVCSKPSFSFVNTHQRQYNERKFGTPIRCIVDQSTRYTIWGACPIWGYNL